MRLATLALKNDFCEALNLTKVQEMLNVTKMTSKYMPSGSKMDCVFLENHSPTHDSTIRTQSNGQFKLKTT